MQRVDASPAIDTDEAPEVREVVGVIVNADVEQVGPRAERGEMRATSRVQQAGTPLCGPALKAGCEAACLRFTSRDRGNYSPVSMLPAMLVAPNRNVFDRSRSSGPPVT